MSGTKIGGRKARETNYLKHGKDFYRKIGKKGGSRTGILKGFALMSKERVSECGRKGGRISRKSRKKEMV